MKNLKPKEWRRKQAQLFKGSDCIEPPFLYKLPALRNVGEEQEYEKHGLCRVEDLLTSLSKMKCNLKFNQFIKGGVAATAYAQYNSCTAN